MNLQIAENTDIRTVETLIKEALALGMRVVHHPDPKPRLSNVVAFSYVMLKPRTHALVGA